MINALFTAFALIAAGQAEAPSRDRGASLERARTAPEKSPQPARETRRARD